MSMDTPNSNFHSEPYNIQTILDNLDSSSQTDQDDMSLPLFHFKSSSPSFPTTSIPPLKKTPSTNSASSHEDTINSNAFVVPNLTLQNVLNAMTSQKASIYLQKIIREMKQMELISLLNELKGNFFCLMIDKNGNYLCSDIFKLCTPLQRKSIIMEILNFIDDISIHEFGTHSIQTLIELTSTKDEAYLLSESLCNEVKMQKVALHPRGAYVIQKMIIKIPEDIRDHFNMFLLKIVHLLSVDVFGVCTVKQFALFTKKEKTIVQFLNIVYNHFYFIAKNKYGNYLIQFILKLWWNKSEMFVFKVLIEKSFYELAIDEFSSHIVETYVKMLSYDDKKRIYANLLQKGMFGALINNRYGIFVVNKIVNCLK